MVNYEKYTEFLVEGPDDVGIITVSLTGPRLHSISDQAHGDLVKLWLDIAEDEDARVVILRGEGEEAFSSGGSFDTVLANASDYEARKRNFREARELVRNIIEVPIPIVTAINGPAAGAGLAMAMFSDITIVGKNAKIIDGHVRLGIAAGDHAALAWPMLTSMAKAKYYLLTNDALKGEEAERIGLVSMAVEDDKVQQTAREVAEKLAKGSKHALFATKHSLNHWYRQNFPLFDASLAYEFFDMPSPDVQEGVASFREKRAPRFQ